MTTPAKNTVETSDSASAAVQTPFRRFLSDFAESRVALFGLAVFALIVFIAVFAPHISPQDPYDLAQLDFMDGRLEPGSENVTYGYTYWLDEAATRQKKN